MSSSGIRRLAIGAVALAVVLLLPLATSASMLGQCEAEAHTATSGVSFNQDEWHIKRTDTAGGSGQSSTKMTKANVYAFALGIALPITGGEAKPGDEGQTEGSVEGIAVSSYAVLGARFTVQGVASGPGGVTCTGTLRIILDDVNPALTVLGGGGILVAIIALIIILALMRGGGGCLPRVVGCAAGLAGGCGAGLAAEQFGVIDATSYFGLVIGAAGAIAGFLLPGAAGGGGGAGADPAPAAPSAKPLTSQEYGETATDIYKGGEETPATGDATGGQVVGGQTSDGGAAAAGETNPGGGVGGSADGNPSPGDRIGAKGDVLPPGGEGGGGPM
jgi:hypothetical protein